MPVFSDDSDTMEQHQAAHFGFSAAPLDELDADGYTLGTIAIDCSSSTYASRDEMEKALKAIVEKCQRNNPRADNMLLRVLIFHGRTVEEVHGFKLLSEIGLDAYSGCLTGGGSTNLFDACVDGLDAIAAFGDTLIQDERSVNGFFAVVTDGMENSSKLNPSSSTTPDPKYVREAMQNLLRTEKLESLLSILVGVDLDSFSKSALDQFHNDAGFSQYVELGGVDAVQLGDWVSQSFSAQSQSLGTGSASQPIDPNASGNASVSSAGPTI